MSHPKRHKIEEEEFVGFKYLKKITQLLERLHDAGCARDRAGNGQFVSVRVRRER